MAALLTYTAWMLYGGDHRVPRLERGPRPLPARSR